MPYDPQSFILPEDGVLYLKELAADPDVPPDGIAVMWLSDGTGTGSDGDVLIKRNISGVEHTQYIAGPLMDSETVITTNVILAAESPKVFFLSLAGGFTSTLPAPAAGLYFRFVVKTAPTTAYIIATNAGADIMIGGINENEVDTNDDGPYDANADSFDFVANLAAVGDYVTMISDGTSWYYEGQTNLDGGVTTATA